MNAWFGPTKPARIAEEQLHEAQREYLTHAAAAEHHTALRDMFAQRIERLQQKAASAVASKAKP